MLPQLLFSILHRFDKPALNRVKLLHLKYIEYKINITTYNLKLFINSFDKLWHKHAFFIININKVTLKYELTHLEEFLTHKN